jgi:DNA polymerase-1
LQQNLIMTKMKTAFFDIETEAISNWDTLDGLETVHCMVVIDYEGVVHRFRQDKIRQGYCLLAQHDYIVGHNAINFDGPVLKKLYGFRHPGLYDTLVLSQLSYPDLKTDDWKRAEFPKNLIGSHSLKAWGIRLGIHKDSHGETEDWSKWSKEMEDYCVQDVKVTAALFNYLTEKRKYTQQAVALETSFAKLMRTQTETGFPFNTEGAEDLIKTLMVRRTEIEQELQEVFEPTVVEMKSCWWVAGGKQYASKKAAVNDGHKAKDVERGPKKTKETPFNPGSRDQIAARLMAAGWEPEEYEGKRPAINEAVLRKIDSPQALKLLEYLLVSKRLGQIAEGNQAWLKLAHKGRIHGSVNTIGTVSGRCSHHHPNMAQVPAVRAEYGKECRALFTAPKDKVLVGADASGLELRCLAHYMHQWDNGQYAREILEGDIHTANQKAAGLENRDQAKTFIYCLIYGGGDKKLGEIVGGSNKEGKQLRASFMSKIPAIKSLTSAIHKQVEKEGVLRGLDGRYLPCRSMHSSLNLLLQSAGAVIMKQALVEFDLDNKDIPYKLHANVHDEVQFSCNRKQADALGHSFVSAIIKAGKILNFKCPLDGEFKVGANWAETH